MIPHQDLVGLPYVTDSRDPKVGLNCTGATVVVLERLGVQVPPGNPTEALQRLGWVRVRGGFLEGDVFEIKWEGHHATAALVDAEHRRCLLAIGGKTVRTVSLVWVRPRSVACYRCLHIPAKR